MTIEELYDSVEAGDIITFKAIDFLVKIKSIRDTIDCGKPPWLVLYPLSERDRFMACNIAIPYHTDSLHDIDRLTDSNNLWQFEEDDDLSKDIYWINISEKYTVWKEIKC